MRRIRTAAIAVTAALLIPASAAATSAYTRVLQSYERTGGVPPCTFSSAELSSALKGVDTYGAQYFADFTDAINAALAARASGQCLSRSGVAQAAPAASAGRLPGQPLAIGSLTSGSAAGLPLPILLMAVIAGATAIALALGAAVQLLAWDPSWVARWRHAWGEAGYRVGGAWAGFVDWLRSA